MKAKQRGGGSSISPYIIVFALVLLGLSRVLPSWGPSTETLLLQLGLSFQPIPTWTYHLLAWLSKWRGWAIIGVTAIFVPLHWWTWGELL